MRASSKVRVPLPSGIQVQHGAVPDLNVPLCTVGLSLQAMSYNTRQLHQQRREENMPRGTYRFDFSSLLPFLIRLLHSPYSLVYDATAATIINDQ